MEVFIFKVGLYATRVPWLSLMHIPFSKANRSVGVGRERDGVALSETRAALLMHRCPSISIKSDSINREKKMRRIKGSKQKQKLTGKKGL